MPRRAVLFDLYDTLLIAGDRDRMREDWTAAFKATMMAAGLALSDYELSRLSDTLWTFQSLYSRPDGFTVYEGRINDFAVSRGFSPRPELVRHTAISTLAGWQRHWRLDPTAQELLAELRGEGFATALVTNFDHWPHVRLFLKRQGLDALFDVIAISSEERIDKPDPEIFLGVLEKLGVSPADAVHIGDHDDDVMGATAAGITPIRLWRADPAQRSERPKPGSRLGRLFRRERRPERRELEISGLEEAIAAVREAFGIDAQPPADG
jgi:putative hydrolase of the HAD superfamily